MSCQYAIRIAGLARPAKAEMSWLLPYAQQNALTIADRSTSAGST